MGHKSSDHTSPYVWNQSVTRVLTRNESAEGGQGWGGEEKLQLFRTSALIQSDMTGHQRCREADACVLCLRRTNRLLHCKRLWWVNHRSKSIVQKLSHGGQGAGDAI